MHPNTETRYFQHQMRKVHALWIGAFARRNSLPGSMKSSIIVSVFGTVALAAIMQWTASSVQKHVKIASQSIFSAALDSQRASTAFAKMNREYSDAVVIEEHAALKRADREGATVLSSLDRVGVFMNFNPARHRQVVALRQRVATLQIQSVAVYTEFAEPGSIPPSQQVLASLSRENNAVRAELEALQSDLAGDFRAELSLINQLLWIQGIFQVGVIVGVIIALFFSIRSMIHASVQMREDDILRQTHAEREGERKMLHALIDNIPDCMYVKDFEGRFVVANPHLADLMGAKTPEDLLGKTDFDFYPKELADVFYQDEQDVMRSGQPLFNREEKSIHGEGNEVYILTTKVPIRDSEGHVIGIAGVGRDISARKKMENELHEAERNYRGIFDNAIVGIFQSTPAGRFLSVNSSMASTHGYDSPEEMIASITDISRQYYVDPNRRKEFMLLMDQLSGVLSFECEAFRKDGSKIWLSLSVRTIVEDGKVVRYEGMCEDITERFRLREQLLQAQKLESVGHLAAGIAHEINTPTQYIGDNVRFMKDAFQDMKQLLAHYERLLLLAKSGDLTPEAIREIEEAVKRADAGYLLAEIPKAVDQTLEGVTRVSTIVSAMREFSHPGTKEKIPIDLNRAIESTITVARNEWKYVADLETALDPALPPILCLPGELNQVILNLIVNAAHAIADVVHKGGPEKGTIRVQTLNLPEWAEIRVQDTGSGIPEEIRTRVFDPFFTSKEIGKGTGQGLAIARSVIVDKHAGTIHFETETGSGTTFIIRLPYDGKAFGSKAVAA
jgi:PAS domain S-box-containing protein